MVTFTDLNQVSSFARNLPASDKAVEAESKHDVILSDQVGLDWSEGSAGDPDFTGGDHFSFNNTVGSQILNTD